MAAREDEDEKVCRLCRTGEDDGLPVLPWACRGSAKWIHKACLKVEEWRRTGSTEDAAYRCGQCMDQLSDLPLELQVHIANAVGGRSDRAALALASPRLLGLAACRQLPSYQGLEMSLAFHHMLGGVIDERVLRGYASRAEATLEGCGWLTEVAAAAGLRTLRLTGSGLGSGPGSVREAEQQWYLMQPDSTVGALLRFRKPHATDYYESAEGEERLVRSDYGSGDVYHFEGEKDAERQVRVELSSGAVFHYEGEKGVERLVRQALDEHSFHYKGEKGLERKVRYDSPSRGVDYYEGENGAERMVRCEQEWGVVHRYEGEKGAERMVRYGLPFGVSIHHRGERGTERPKIDANNLLVATAFGAIFYFILCLWWQIMLYLCWLQVSSVVRHSPPA